MAPNALFKDVTDHGEVEATNKVKKDNRFKSTGKTKMCQPTFSPYH